MTSRLVARGDMQRANVDFGELYSLTVAISSVRLLAAMAYGQDLALRRFDIEQVFIESELEEDVFMRLPPGCGRLSGKIVRLPFVVRIEASE